MKKLIFYVLLLSLAFSSCNRAGDQIISNDAYEAKGINFIGRMSDNSQFAKRTPRQEGVVSIVIFEFSIGRESRGCKGFGVCDFEWFPGFKVSKGDVYERAEVWKYEDGTYDLEFYVDEEVSDPTDPSLNIVVDNDLVSGAMPDNTVLYIKAGTYAFDPSLGDHGGYNIPVFEYN